MGKHPRSLAWVLVWADIASRVAPIRAKTSELAIHPRLLIVIGRARRHDGGDGPSVEEPSEVRVRLRIASRALRLRSGSPTVVDRPFLSYDPMTLPPRLLRDARASSHLHRASVPGLSSALLPAIALGALVVAGCSTDEPGGPGTTGSGGGPDCVVECGTDNIDGKQVFEHLLACLEAECAQDCGSGAGGAGGASGTGGSGGASGAGGAPSGECDGKGVCTDDDDSSTNDCSSCALEAPCAAKLKTCQDSSACVAFAQCVQACPDPG